MAHMLINVIETAQRITLGQVDQEAITMAVECADPLAIVKHGRVEAFLVPAGMMSKLVGVNSNGDIVVQSPSSPQMISVDVKLELDKAP